MISYNDIKTEVTARLGNRQDISTRIDRWINYSYFELLMNPRFSFYELDTITTPHTTATSAVISLPEDVWVVLGVRDNTNNRRIRQVHWQVIDDTEQTAGQPTRYYRYTPGVLYLDPIPDADYAIQVRYRFRPVDIGSPGVGPADLPMGTEWEEPIVTLAYIKGCEALEMHEKAASGRQLLEPMLQTRQDVPMLDDEDSDWGFQPALAFRQ